VLERAFDERAVGRAELGAGQLDDLHQHELEILE
jgi:hypothetical protein